MSKSESQQDATVTMKISEAGAAPVFGCELVVQAQKSKPYTASSDAHQTHKRKLGGVDTVNKENALFPNVHCTLGPSVKRIRREKTGTDWQSVLDVIAYGEEQNNRQDKDKDVAVTKEET
ncbi:hypothetical protein EDD22DRAFT_850210 [Suillus occidentalis]|nr:hypothetical protein EDD22DRAFT_850210 [Suillus occidentalis]